MASPPWPGVASDANPAPWPAAKPTSRRPRPFGVDGSSSRPALAMPARFRRDAMFSSARPAEPRQRAVAVDDHDFLAGGAQRVGELLDRGGVRARRGGRAAEVAGVAAQRRVERDEEALGAARGEAQRGRGVGIERGRARGRDDELGAVAADALADPQVPDRRLVDRVAVHEQHGVRELEVRDRRLQLRVGERAHDVQRQVLAGTRREMARAELVAQQAGEQERLFVGGRAAGQRTGAVARLLEGGGGGRDGLLPARGQQLLAVTHERRRDALVRVHGLVAEAALVAQPAVVDLAVVAGEHAQDALVADGQLDVALRGAARAHGAGPLDVPRARAEAVRAGRQGAHRAQLDDVAAERRDVRVPVERGDVGRGAALLEHELVVLGDLLRVAHAAVAEDAALAVDRDQRRELQRLLEVALGLDEPARPGTPPVGDVLQRALAALVAHRAVQRVVDEQELDHRALGVVHALRLRVDDHAVADRRGAAGLQLRDALDLHQAHAARADGLAELGLVTEDGDLGVAVRVRGVDQDHPLGRVDLATVEGEGDLSDYGARHLSRPPGRGRGAGRGRRARRG